MKILNTLVFLLYGLSAFCQTAANNYEKKVLAAVRAAPEVKDFYQYAKKHEPTMVYNGGPTKDLNYYWVQVGYGDGGMMRTIFHFYVHPKTFEVFYVDLATSRGGFSVLPLAKWRVLRKTAGWHKMHYFENGKLMVEVAK